VPDYRTGKPENPHARPPDSTEWAKLGIQAVALIKEAQRHFRLQRALERGMALGGMVPTPPNDADSNLACSQVDGLEPGVC
jgi:hypothetical protein